MIAEIEKAEIRLPLEDIPQPDPGEWVRLAPDFKEKAKLAASVASKNLAKPALTCIHLQGNVIEATDSFRIVRCRTDASLPEGIDLLVPKNSMSSLLKFSPIALAFANGWVSFQTGEGVIFSCRVADIDTCYPNLESALRLACENPINFAPDALAGILDRAIHFADTDSVGDPRVNVSAMDNLLVVEAGQNGARFRETYRVDSQQDLKFCANPAFLKEALATKFDRGFFSKQGTSIFIKFEKESVTHMLVVGTYDASDKAKRMARVSKDYNH